MVSRVRHSKGHLGSGAAVLACIFLSWLVLLAGIAACQQQVLVRSALEFEWWIICFEFLLVLLAATHLTGLHRSHAGLVALKAVNTVLCLVYANIWNKVYRQGGVGATYPTNSDVSTVSGVTHKRIDTALAGFILLSIFNLLLLAILGTAPTNVGSFNKQEMGSTRDTQMTNTTTTTPYVTSAGAPAQGGVVGAGATVV